MLGVFHTAVQVLVFATCMMAAVRLPSSYRSLIYIRPVTALTLGGAAICCGLAFLGMALDMSSAPFFTVIDFVMAVCMVSFLILLGWDLNVAMRRLSNAFTRLRGEFGPESGDRMVAIIITALQRR